MMIGKAHHIRKRQGKQQISKLSICSEFICIMPEIRESHMETLSNDTIDISWDCR
jgi:hypothetical protein